MHPVTDTPAEVATKLDQFSRSNYETARKTYRTTSLSYDEALVVAPAAMDNFARYAYEGKRKTYEATRKTDEGRSLSYDETLALSRSG